MLKVYVVVCLTRRYKLNVPIKIRYNIILSDISSGNHSLTSKMRTKNNS